MLVPDNDRALRDPHLVLAIRSIRVRENKRSEFYQPVHSPMTNTSMECLVC